MKIRNDFVTNSSSSSFIIARKDSFNNKQKEAILNYIESKFFGKSKYSTIIKTIDELDQYAKQHYWIYNDELDDYYKDNYHKCKAALKSGKTIYIDNVVFECCEDDYASIYDNLWEIVAKNDTDKSFEIIDGDLSY